MQYERVITRGNSKDATSRDREMAASRSKALRERYAAYLLRREKKDVLKIDRRYRYLIRAEECQGLHCQHLTGIYHMRHRERHLCPLLKLCLLGATEG